MKMKKIISFNDDWPEEWGKKGCPLTFISSVKLLADHTWEVIK